MRGGRWFELELVDSLTLESCLLGVDLVERVGGEEEVMAMPTGDENSTPFFVVV